MPGMQLPVTVNSRLANDCSIYQQSLSILCHDMCQRSLDAPQLIRGQAHDCWGVWHPCQTLRTLIPLLQIWPKKIHFFGVVFCGGKTQIRLKNQYLVGVSHTRLVLLHTYGCIRAERGQIGTTCAKYPFGWPCLYEWYARWKRDQKSPVWRAEWAKPTLDIAH